MSSSSTSAIVHDTSCFKQVTPDTNPEPWTRRVYIKYIPAADRPTSNEIFAARRCWTLLPKPLRPSVRSWRPNGHDDVLALLRVCHTAACSIIIEYCILIIEHDLILTDSVTWLQYTAFREHGLPEAVKVSQLLVAIASAGVIAIVWWLRPVMYDYSAVLDKSLLFFEAQRSGGCTVPLDL